MGITKIFSSVDVMRPPKTTIAIGLWISLPGSFDVVTAFETIYFWPDIEHCFNEVKKVLKPGGQFVIVNESDGSGEMDAKWESMIECMHTYTPEEIRRHLTNVGFRDLNITVNEEKRWLCTTARK